MTKEPWNKNKSVGQKKALTPRQTDLIRKELGNQCLTRDLCLFNLALTSNLKANELLRLKIFEIKMSENLGHLAKSLIAKEKKSIK